MDIVTLSKQRYATKAYDPNKKIPQEQIDQLCTLLQNCPSSVNSQPWHFVVASTDEGKAKIAQASTEPNKNRILNASHVIIFAVRTEFGEAHLTRLLEQEDKDGRFPTPQNKAEQEAGRRHFWGLNNTSQESLIAWESKQVYLALGTLLHGAAVLGIQSTPIEGIFRDRMDEVLGLKEKGLTTVVAASLGYRSEEDFNANLPKSRLPKEELFTYL